MSESGWYPDPYARFDYRYFDGVDWTDRVSSGDGRQTTDRSEHALTLVGAAAVPASTPTPVPGWYDDPDQSGGRRYWDGAHWGEQRLSVSAPAAPQEGVASTPAGWYDDPERPAERRYWDGHGWTDRRMPQPPVGPPAVAQPTSDTSEPGEVSEVTRWIIVRTGCRDLREAGHGQMVHLLQQELAWLESHMDRRYELDEEFEIHREVIRRVGEELDRRGGFRLMQQYGEELGSSRSLEMYWDGIGDWLG